MSKSDSTAPDRRRMRGDRTRAAVAVRAAERASVDGLDGVSLGEIAADLGMSKSGIQAVFATKEALQLAAVAAASAIFAQRVVLPALPAPEGLARLWALIEAWLAYVGDKVFPGGCFLASTVPEFDSRPGPVRSALADAHRAWLDILEGQAAAAQARGELDSALSADLVAFEIDAVLTLANTVCNLEDRPESLAAARAVLLARLGGVAAPRHGRTRGSRRQRPTSS